MINYLDEFRGKLVHFLFPFVERFYPVLSFVLILPVWFIPQAYWQIRMVLFFLWFILNEIHWVGTMERDYLPIQPKDGFFYHLYRFVDRFIFLLFLIFVVVLFSPGSMWLKDAFCGVLVIIIILRAIGDRKYHTKKPEE